MSPGPPWSTHLTTVLYRVGLLPGFQLQGYGPLLQGSVAAVVWSLDLNSSCHIDFPFQTKPWRPNVLFYIYQLRDPDTGCRILPPTWGSAVARAEITETDRQLAAKVGEHSDRLKTVKLWFNWKNILRHLFSYPLKSEGRSFAHKSVVLCVCVYVYLHLEADGFRCWGAEVFFGPKFQRGQVIMQLLLHLFLTYTQTVPEDTWRRNQHE